MSLTIFDEKFIEYWKSLNFDGWNESDVREDFIAPLLKILGYAKGTVNEITREQSLNLSEKYHRIGRKQVAIDYVPTIRLKKFWIIEAKPGKPKEMDFGDYLQAHLYAIHPEINVRFILVTNGWEVRVYDALTSNSWDDYILKITQENCQSIFEELKNLLSSQYITKSLRRYILSTIAETLKVEIDENEADELKKEVSKIYVDAIPIIRKNAHEFKIQAWRKKDEEAKKWIETITLKELFIYMDRPTEAIPWYSEECIKRIKNASQDERNEILGKLAMNYRGRPHGVFRVQCVYVMCRLLEEEIEASSPYAVSVKDSLKELVESNLVYWGWPIGDKIDHIGFALSHLDNICSRLSYKFCRRFAMETFEEIVDAKKSNFSTEDLLANKPTIAREVVDSVRFLNEILWRRYSGYDSKKIWKYIWNLQVLEEHIEKIPEVEYKDGDMDLLNFDRYGIDFDMYCVGTWNVLQSMKDKISHIDLPDTVLELIAKSREEVISEIPKPLPKPANWSYELTIPLESLKQFWAK